MAKSMKKRPQGRPKTFNREECLKVAMHLYWREGVDGISLNEICRLAGVSKPALYREFGSDDGLMSAALGYYKENLLDPTFALLDEDLSYQETLKRLISLVTSSSGDFPKGCLFVKMRSSRLRVGEQTRKQIDMIQRDLLKKYVKWIELCKSKKEIPSHVDSKFTAAYINSQLGNAKSLEARGERSKDVRAILELALSAIGK